jgi:hypothetical protein
MAKGIQGSFVNQVQEEGIPVVLHFDSKMLPDMTCG